MEWKRIPICEQCIMKIGTNKKLYFTKVNKIVCTAMNTADNEYMPLHTDR